MISKELLSEVLGSPVEKISFDKDNDCEVRHGLSFENKIDGVSYIYVYGNKESRFMPIHELAHKCKEWAYKEGYGVESFYTEHTYQANNEADGEEARFKSTKLALVRVNKDNKVVKHYYESVEPEAIFKACQWILEND